MESVLPALIAVTAITLTYFMCIRPMRRGQCGTMPPKHAGGVNSEREAEIARLRAEVAELRRSPESPLRASGAATDAAGGRSAVRPEGPGVQPPSAARP